jgi:hypothetical protein
LSILGFLCCTVPTSCWLGVVLVWGLLMQKLGVPWAQPPAYYGTTDEEMMMHEPAVLISSDEEDHESMVDQDLVEASPRGRPAGLIPSSPG